MTTVNADRSDEEVLRFLRRIELASKWSHSGRTFLDHLIGTWQLLRRWNMPREVSQAGLLHSAYSTSFYSRALFSLQERNIVRQLIGTNAEAIVYRFCVIDRPKFWATIQELPQIKVPLTVKRNDSEQLLRLSPGCARRLLIIESANIAEQSAADDGSPGCWVSLLSSWTHAFRKPIVPFLTLFSAPLKISQERSALVEYKHAIEGPRRVARRCLDEVIRRNQYVGEPYLLRAILALENGQHERAITDAVRAQHLQAVWSVAWDKRKSFEWWSGLAAQTLSIAVGSNRPSIDFDLVCRLLVDASGR